MNINSAQLSVLRPLARAFGHGWATDPLGPTDSEILNLGVEAAVAAWEVRLQAADAEQQLRDLADAEGDAARIAYLERYPYNDGYKFRGLAPATTHRSTMGTVRWSVTVAGDAHLQIFRRGAEILLWEIRKEGGRVTALTHGPGLVPGEYGDHEKEQAHKACSGLGVSPAWAADTRLSPPPAVTPGPVRRL